MSDLISRQAVLDELEKWDWQDLYLPIHFKQILDDISPVENKGEWIPVSEKNPGIGKHVLVCLKDGYIDTDDYYSYGFDDWKHLVVAWQPLPEPYKAEKGSEE